MIDTKKLSIIVPIYKVKKEYLDKCIDSLIKQSYKDIEIILVDDGSPDKCGEYCDQYAKSDNRIKVIHQKNQGVSVARNTGIDNASGEWLLFVDGDDWLEKDACDVYANIIDNEKNIDLIISKSYIYKSNTEKNENYSYYKGKTVIQDKKEIYDSILLSKNKSNVKFTYIGAPWGKCFKKDIIRKNNVNFKQGIKIGEDALFNCLYLQYTNKIISIPEKTYYYRINNSSVMNNYSSKLISSYEALFFEFSKIKNIDGIDERNYSAFVIRQLLKCLYLDIFNNNNPNSKKDRKTKFKTLINEEPYRNALKVIKITNFQRKEGFIIILLKLKNFEICDLFFYLKRRIKKGC